tara:strand:- start:260 stop:439 length:180 start_codon:yes stop_codon:yes gene_type:complete
VNKYTQDMTGTGDHITLPSEPVQLELFPELVDDPEPERYYDWILWSLRQKMKKDQKKFN